MALALATVADSISKLSVSGLTIRDINEIPVVADTRISQLIPGADYVTDIAVEVNSWGGAAAKLTVTYTLNYRLLYKELGTGRTMTLEQISGLVSLIALVWDAVMAIDTIDGAVDVSVQSISNFGVVNDPSDNGWWGADLGFRVKEFVR
jgi:hypothetical protein